MTSKSRQSWLADTAGNPGQRYCDRADDGNAWGHCVTAPDCELGAEDPCTFPESADGGMGASYCILHEGEPRWDSDVTFDAGCNTPLVLSFDGRPARFEPAPVAAFDIDGVGACLATDWPTAETPWLARDLDRDGAIRDGSELFGSGTVLGNGRRAQHGFAALAELDSNGDGRISALDAAFDTLLLWADHDADKRGMHSEFAALRQGGIVEIELAYTTDAECDERGNCQVERARFTYEDGRGGIQTGQVIDLHLACQ